MATSLDRNPSESCSAPSAGYCARMTTARLPASRPAPITTKEEALQRVFRLRRIEGEDDQRALKVVVAETAAFVDEMLRSVHLRTRMAKRLGTALDAWSHAPTPPALRWEEQTRPFLEQPITVAMFTIDGSRSRVSDDLNEEKQLRERLVALHAKMNFPVEKTPGPPVAVERSFGGVLRYRMKERNMVPASALETGLLAFFIGVAKAGPGRNEDSFRKRWEGLMQRGQEAEESVPDWARAP